MGKDQKNNPRFKHKDQRRAQEKFERWAGRMAVAGQVKNRRVKKKRGKSKR